ncbi:MAG: hypothetical protein HYT87_14790 [Nitrospirae bacterium]|nr:hypothetical protein [Nitrospirota bacterium]
MSTPSILPSEAAKITRLAFRERLSLDSSAKVLGFLGLANAEDMELVGDLDAMVGAVKHRMRTHLRRRRPDLVVTCLAAGVDFLMLEVCEEEAIPFVVVAFLDRVDVDRDGSRERLARRHGLMSKARQVVFVADPLDAEGDEKATRWVATHADRVYAISGEVTEESMARLETALRAGSPVRVEPIEFCETVYAKWVDDRFCDLMLAIQPGAADAHQTTTEQTSCSATGGEPPAVTQ